ncbi:4'-phosphopantetheinyl transferase superfamily protein [Pseudoduganella sp. FT25W]|uniref:4'-phosphopantetheinyl transferase superfamily protein n=1 Tax=Duganella alba TaxID=2666081 RepID=A0A6L5QCR4_9BURK|nr:4'-phosphopantetheinyl transferase superfamily protein [Duganella alba]MRX07419.1 4'-phosphopantetheinyl transferase superfamily protein [Duganella alba]MRX19722.1 4'-phosphopantetheinyl transferase superfamily protein [Duganella alba]
MTKAAVWMVDANAVTEAGLQHWRGWLSADEMARHQRFVRAQRQRQFVVGRVMLRMALGRLLGVAPQEIRLEERVGNAPRLISPALKGATPGFSISHSGRWVACAVSAQTALGLDIEMMDPARDLHALAAQAFDSGEMAQWERMQGLPDGQRVEGFYRLWSEKEARFKLAVVGGGHCIALPHAELSIALCSEQSLERPPLIEVITLE